jgi:hypothetical protein
MKTINSASGLAEFEAQRPARSTPGFGRKTVAGDWPSLNTRPTVTAFWAHRNATAVSTSEARKTHEFRLHAPNLS